jgi:energy-coupling factor transporter ATP-binding protein EcfA2
MGSATNPFSTRFITPGAVPFVFPPQVDAPTLISRLAIQGWWGQIVGPHGSGKSTLLKSLLPLLKKADRHAALYRLTAGQRPLHSPRREAAHWNEHTLVVVDGYEQLGWLEQWRLRHSCRQRGAGLLVTAHQPMAGLPMLLTTETTREIAREVVARLLNGASHWISDAEIEHAFLDSQGNLREMLFKLYDSFEQRHVASGP